MNDIIIYSPWEIDEKPTYEYTREDSGIWKYDSTSTKRAKINELLITTLDLQNQGITIVNAVDRIVKMYMEYIAHRGPPHYPSRRSTRYSETPIHFPVKLTDADLISGGNARGDYITQIISKIQSNYHRESDTSTRNYFY